MTKPTLILLTLLLASCDTQFARNGGTYSLFETSAGTVYLLNTATGETRVISKLGTEGKLQPTAIYQGEDGKIYQYDGAGKLKELSVREAADRILENSKK